MIARTAFRSAAPLRRCAAALSTTPASKAEIDLIQALLTQAKQRVADEEKAAAAAAAADGNGPKFQVQTFNAISPVGLERFPKSQFSLTGSSGAVPAGMEEEPHCILLRSHKLQPDEVAPSVRAIARCGAGTNNVPIDAMTARGIPVFNTPGANANAVKELVLCGLFLGSRGIVQGIDHVKTVLVPELKHDPKALNARVEKAKAKFVGGEVAGKTLAVAGLGNIGAMVAESAIALGMNVVGFDPKISVEAAWRLPSTVQKMNSLEEAFAVADFVSVNMPYIKNATHHIINEDCFASMKPSCTILNFARGEIVDGAALKAFWEKTGGTGQYISDFPDEHLQEHPNFMCIPHLGASTAEAEDNCARMAAEQVLAFLETGTIKNSVNFPAASLEAQGAQHTRLCIINENKPGVLGEITTLLGSEGVNIAQQLNTSRDTIAYNVIDLDTEKAAAEAAVEKLHKIDGVLSTRLIWTGSAAEGPSNFYPAAVC